MRGAHDAPWHATEILRRSPRTRTDRARAFTGDVAESAAKSPKTLPPRLEGNFGDGLFGVPKQRRGPLDAPREEVSVRRHPEGILERARKMRRGNAAHPRQPPHGPGLVRGGIHPVLRAQQASQQLGVLRWSHWSVPV